MANIGTYGETKPKLNIGTLYLSDTQVLPTAAQINAMPRVASVALAAVDTGGGLFAWQNPETGSIAVTKIILDVTTKATGSCTADIGTTATSATTSTDNLIDGVDVGTAVICADNITNKGTNGKSIQKLATGKWVTGSVASGASAGIVGTVYIEYVVL